MFALQEKEASDTRSASSPARDRTGALRALVWRIFWPAGDCKEHSHIRCTSRKSKLYSNLRGYLRHPSHLAHSALWRSPVSIGTRPPCGCACSQIRSLDPSYLVHRQQNRL